MLLQVEIWQTVDRDQLRRDLQMVLSKGIRSLAVTLMHSYLCVSLFILLTGIIAVCCFSSGLVDCRVSYNPHLKCPSTGSGLNVL